MQRELARRLLDRIGSLRQTCDLDLLLFFVRHPRALLTSDQLATFLGYEVKQVGESLNVLVKAELVTRTQKLTSAQRLYALAASGTSGVWLPSFVELGSTREGRLAMRDALKASQGKNDEETPSLKARRDSDPEGV